MKGIIIQGSARSKGNTFKVNRYLMELADLDLVDLKEKHILPFDYLHKNAQDDFIPLIKRIVENYDLIIFSSPVYWYSMSGTMKIFFDRISDCLKTEKELGRKLRGKKMAVISCGSDSELNQAFIEPFQLSAEYLGMKYVGAIHAWISETELSQEVKMIIQNFAKEISKAN